MLQWLLGVKPPITAASRAEIREWLEARGGRLGKWVPHNAFLVELPTYNMESILEDLISPEQGAPGVVSLEPFRADFKYSEDLFRAVRQSSPRSSLKSGN